jgi:hypothetical protein
MLRNAAQFGRRPKGAYPESWLRGRPFRLFLRQGFASITWFNQGTNFEMFV